MSPDVRGAYFGSLDRAFEGFTYVGNSGSRYMSEAAGSSHGAGRRYATLRYSTVQCSNSLSFALFFVDPVSARARPTVTAITVTAMVTTKQPLSTHPTCPPTYLSG